MSHVEKLLASNEDYVNQFAQGELPSPPATKVAVLTCMDSRIDPLAALGSRLGDIHVIRNAGGRVTDDAIRSLVISEQMLGTEEILVLQHEDCGMLSFRNEDLVKKISDTVGAEASEAANDIDFLPFVHLEQNVRQDVEVLRQSPLIPDHIHIVGGIYDVSTGAVRRVC